MFIQHTLLKLWVLIYSAVEINFTIVILLLEWPSEQTELVSVMSYDQINKLLCHIVVMQIGFFLF